MAASARLVGSLAASCLLSLSTGAGAQQPSINLRAFAPSTSPDATFLLEPANVQGAWQTNSSAWLGWAYRPLVLRRDGEIVGAIVRHQTSLDAGFSMGLGRRAEVGVMLPVLLDQASDENAETQRALEGGAVATRALGDLSLQGKVNLHRVEDLGGPGLALVGRMTLPTGDRASGLGEGSVTTELRALGEYRLIASGFRVTAGVRTRGAERTFVGKTWGDELPWGASFYLAPRMFGLDPKGRWAWSLEAHGALPLSADAPLSGAAQTTAFVGPSARYRVRDLSLLGGLEAGLTQGAGSAPLRVVAQVAWAPRDHDRDHDGIEDDKDECPALAEDRDGFQDHDGCPEGDNDEDNVMDADDRCPLVAEDEDGFEDEDGCPDPDNDRDGVFDAVDACPNEAGARSQDPSRNGCPERDGDGDGVLEPADRCPDAPEDRDGFQDEDGCPDPDNDGDGVLDVDDACRDVRGERSAIPSLNGCPSPDRDDDGIANERDRCPDQAETYNGLDDDDGCPEPEDKRRGPLVVIEPATKKLPQRLVLRGAVRFQGEGAELTPESQALLRAVGQALAAHPELRVLVAVRPGKGAGADEITQARAALVVGEIQHATRRPSSALAAPWDRTSAGASGAGAGVSLVLVQGGP